jgi:MFS family permease
VHLLNKIAEAPPCERRARAALTAFFATDGFIFASWAVRVPAIKQQTGASPAALGLALLGLSTGAVATMLVAGMLCHRFGAGPTTVGSCVLLSLTLLLLPLSTSAITLGLALLAFGACYGCMNVAINSVATELVNAIGRPIMPSFHAAWSFGGLAGATIGGLLAAHLSPRSHLALVSMAGLLVAALAARDLLHWQAPAVTRTAQRQPVSRTIPLVGRLGLIAACSAFGEGAVADWSALHMRQDLRTGAALAAAGYAAFALAEASGRLSGTWLLGRFGLTRVLTASALVVCAGALVVASAPWAWLALAGFAVTGLGVANQFPAAMSRAGLLAGPSGIALASTLGYGGFLLGPPSIGFLTGPLGLRAALTTIALLALIAAALSVTTTER